MASIPPRRRRHARWPVLVALALALLVHVPLALWFVHATWLRETPPPEARPISVRMMRVETPEEEAEEEPEEEEEPDGQIVEIAPPENQERPDEAKYLAEYDSTVPEESVDPRYRLNRELTAETFSPDDAMEEAVADPVDVPIPGAGATSGRKALFRKGNYSLFPDQQSDWQVQNQTGLSSPLPANPKSTRYAGSPSNDMIDEAMKERTALNAQEYLYSAFWNRVKRVVSFYADQTLNNNPPRSALTKSQYTVWLKGLIAPDGALHAIDIARSCGIPEWDQALIEAFQLAAPFADPPEGLVKADGFIHIEGFAFTITLGAARADMSGVDPRSGVQFPGLQRGGR